MAAAFSCLARCGLKTRSLSLTLIICLSSSLSHCVCPTLSLSLSGLHCLSPENVFQFITPATSIIHQPQTPTAKPKSPTPPTPRPPFCYLLATPGSPQMMPNVRLNEHFWLNIGLNSAASSPVASRQSHYTRLPLSPSLSSAAACCHCQQHGGRSIQNQQGFSSSTT